ncbi:MAG: hypothetical protein HQ559_04645 [Lentisphaerae bacterium]|nr:hypothetical protein [Lentisphaerota bacterium]
MRILTVTSALFAILVLGGPSSGGEEPASQYRPLSSPPGGGVVYDLPAIGRLLTNAFTDDELHGVVHEVFPAVYDTFTEGMTRAQKIRNLLEWCQKHVRMDALLDEVRKRNPEMYARYADRVRRPATPRDEGPANPTSEKVVSSTTPPVTQVHEDAGMGQNGSGHAVPNQRPWRASAGLSGFVFDPSLPRDLTIHRTHPDDQAFMPGDPGETVLRRAGSVFLDLGVAGEWELDGGWAWGLGGTLKLPFWVEGRKEIQCENDQRPPTQGSYIYTAITDMQPVPEIGVSIRHRCLTRQGAGFSVVPSLRASYWHMTFEKGWNRFGKDEFEQSSDARGIGLSPSLAVSACVKRWEFTGLGAYRLLVLEYDTTVLGSSVAQGWEVGCSAARRF